MLVKRMVKTQKIGLPSLFVEQSVLTSHSPKQSECNHTHTYIFNFFFASAFGNVPAREINFLTNAIKQCKKKENAENVL